MKVPIHFASTLSACLWSVALFPPAAQAQTTHFTGVASSNWQTSGNWDNGVPTSGSETLINQSANALLNGGIGNTDTLEVDNGRTLTINGGATLNSKRADVVTGSIIVDGVGTVVNVSSVTLADMVVGSFGTGSLTISNSALITTSANLVEFGLGNNGNGSLFLNSGGTLATGDIWKIDSGSVTFNGGIFRALVSTNNVFKSFASGDFTLNSGGGTIDTNSLNITAKNVIDGSGALTKTGSGTLTLSANNTYSGGTILSEGTTRISHNAALGTGTLTFNGGTLQNTAAFSTARDTSLQTGSGTFQTDVGLTHSGDISGIGALTKTGSGSLTLTGDNTFSGGTLIEQAFVIANNMGGGSALGAGNVIVENGGGLGGSGTVGAFIEVRNGGRISPGNSPGTLSVDSIDFLAGSTMTIELGGLTTSLYDRLLVTGTANLGGILNVSYFDSFNANEGDLFTILEAGNITGQFDSFIAPDSQEWQVIYTDNLVQIGILEVAEIIPEPSTFVLFSIYSLFCMRRKR